MRFEAKLMNSKLGKDNPRYKPLHQPSGRSKKKWRNKVMKKTNWYRDGPRDDKDFQQPGSLGGKGNKKSQKYLKTGKSRMNTSTVMFVPNTKGGILLKKLKEMEEKLCILTGFKIKYSESGGTPLANMFNEDMGKGLHCGRDDCPPCDGGEEGKRQNCRLRSILYETSCLICNPVENKDNKKNNNKERLGVKPVVHIKKE